MSSINVSSCHSIYHTQNTPRRVDATQSSGTDVDRASTHGAFCVMYKNCATCNKSFRVKPSHYNKRFNCSKECLTEYFKVTLVGDKNPNWRNGISKKERVCIFCGKAFTNHHALPGTYCSRRCQNTKQAWDKRDKAAEKRANTPRPVKIKKPNKKYHCSYCGTAEVARKVKGCKTCYTKMTSKETECKYCKKVFVQKAGHHRVYCSRHCADKGRKGPGNPNYKGGITPENKKFRASDEYKAWRKDVFVRDRYTCVQCGQLGWELHADHIKPFAYYPELRLDVNNGRTLCKSCHQKTDTYARRYEYNKTKSELLNLKRKIA
jgi:hypothetical protein